MDRVSSTYFPKKELPDASELLDINVTSISSEREESRSIVNTEYTKLSIFNYKRKFYENIVIVLLTSILSFLNHEEIRSVSIIE